MIFLQYSFAPEEHMEGMAGLQPTIAQSLSWVNYTFFRSDSTAAAIPERLLDWRPEDPRGGFQFSLAEIVMHLADARRMFASQLTGVDEAPNYWAPAYWLPDSTDEDSYTFKPYGTKQALLDSLKASREQYAPYLALPATELLRTPPGGRVTFERMLAEYKAAGQDMTVLEQLGPPTIYHVLFMACVHDSGHRGTLHTLLRMHGEIEPD
jgi:uncharacterized damage-inducible protein DinB